MFWGLIRDGAFHFLHNVYFSTYKYNMFRYLQGILYLVQIDIFVKTYLNLQAPFFSRPFRPFKIFDRNKHATMMRR